MKKSLGIVLLCTLMSSVALAAPATKIARPAARTAAPAPATTDTLQVDVIGSKEAPGVFNIVPWKDKTAGIPKMEVSTSILRETLQPLDRDILRREIQLQQSLSDD